MALFARVRDWCVILCAVMAGSTVSAEQMVARIDTPSETRTLLSETRGDALLALMPEMVSGTTLLNQITSPWSRVDLRLNGRSLGRYRAGTLLQVTPRLGENRLQIQSRTDPAAQIELKFGAMRAYGVSTHVVVIEAGRATPLIARTLPRTVSKRISDALEQRTDGGLRRVFALIRSGGEETVPAPMIRNWRAGGERSTEFGGSDGGGDSGSDPVVSDRTEAPATDAAVADNAEDGAAPSVESSSSAESATEDTDDSGFDVSADRRSYY